jgi:RNA polymerase sigma-70 factor, ECF subfamily
MTEPATSDPELIERIRRGDSRAFAEMYTRYRSPVYDYCLRLLRDRPQAEDAVQETFLRVHDGLDTLSDPAAFRVWLFRIARNLIFNSHRHGEKGHYPVDDETPDDVDLEGELIADEEKRSIRSVIDALRPSYREILVLREYEGLSYAEIASIVGVSEDTVKVRLYRARKALSRNYRIGNHEEEST